MVLWDEVMQGEAQFTQLFSIWKLCEVGVMGKMDHSGIHAYLDMSDC